MFNLLLLQKGNYVDVSLLYTHHPSILSACSISPNQNDMMSELVLFQLGFWKKDAASVADLLSARLRHDDL